MHASALCNHLASVSHWRHSLVAVSTLKELERRISISTKKNKQIEKKLSCLWEVSKAFASLRTSSPFVFLKDWESSFSFLLWPSLKTCFGGVNVRLQLGGFAYPLLSGGCNRFGFAVLHSKLGYCTCFWVVQKSDDKIQISLWACVLFFVQLRCFWPSPTPAAIAAPQKAIVWDERRYGQTRGDLDWI